MLSLCGLFSDDFLKCLYLKQLCKIIMLFSENSFWKQYKDSYKTKPNPGSGDLPRPRMVARVSRRWCHHLPGRRPGSLLCNVFYSYIQGCEFQGSTFNFPRTLTWRVHPHLPVMVLRERCLITCLICPPVFSAHVCHTEKDVALPAIPSASCISSSSSL